LSHNNKSFTLILHTRVAEIDYSEAHKNLFTEAGDYKRIPNHRPRGKYNLKYHLEKTDSKRLKSKLEQIIGLAVELAGTKIVYSKKRISLKTNFKYMALEVFRKSLHVCVKNKAGWKCFNLKPNSHLGRIKKALARIYTSSKSPRFKKVS